MNLGKLNYDGSLIHNKFGYRYFKERYVPTGCIVSFRGNMSVTSNLIDLEDKLNNDFIFSEDAVNFCWEIPNLCAVGGVAFQRLFCTYVAHALSNLISKRENSNVQITMKGDDIMVHVSDDTYKKASVSISTNIDNYCIGHLGINILAGEKAPSFAYSTNLTDSEVEEFITIVENIFYETTSSIFLAATKTI